MFVIGERINGMFKDVRKAIQKRDKAVIQEVARRQIDGGADALDINVGPARGDAAENMLWLLETVQEVTDRPLCIDTPRLSVMKKGLEACRNPRIINSSKATEEELEKYVPLAVSSGAQLIALTIDASGVPGDTDGRVMMGATIVTKALDGGLSPAELYIDAARVVHLRVLDHRYRFQHL